MDVKMLAVKMIQPSWDGASDILQCFKCKNENSNKRLKTHLHPEFAGERKEEKSVYSVFGFVSLVEFFCLFD